MLDSLRGVYQAHRAPITAITFADEQTVYTGDRRGWVAQWDRWGCRFRTRAARRGVTALAVMNSEVLSVGSFDGSITQVAWSGLALFSDVLMQLKRGVSALVTVGNRIVASSFRGELLSLVPSAGPSHRVIDRRYERGSAFVRGDNGDGFVYSFGVRGAIEERTSSSLEVTRTLDVPGLMIFDLRAIGSGMVATVGYDHTLRLWHADTWVQFAELDTGIHGLCTIAGVVGPHLLLYTGRSLVAVDLRALRVCEARQMSGLTSVATSRSGARVALGFTDGSLQIWDTSRAGISAN